MSEFVRDFDLVGRPILLNIRSSDNQTIPLQVDVPTGRLWCVHSIIARVSTTATVGLRLMRLELEDPADGNIYRRNVGVEQPENEIRSYHWGLNLPDELAFPQNTGELFSRMPPLWMGVDRDAVDGGGSVRSRLDIRDNNDIDAADSFISILMAITEYKDNPNERSVIALPPTA